MGEVIRSAPLTELAELTRCGRCGAPVLAGHDEGLMARVDLIPVDALGELAALLVGRRTYDVIRRRMGRAAVLVYRDFDRVAEERATEVVALEHKCPPSVSRRSRAEPDPRLADSLLGVRPAAQDLADPPF